MLPIKPRSSIPMESIHAKTTEVIILPMSIASSESGVASKVSSVCRSRSPANESVTSPMITKTGTILGRINEKGLSI